MVEMEDGTIGVVSNFSEEASPGAAEIRIWWPNVALKLGKPAASNPYLSQRIRSTKGLHLINRRVVLNAFGEIVWSEGSEG
jgi:hypothetical protein